MNSVSRVSFAVCLGLSIAALIFAMVEMSLPTLLLAAMLLFVSAIHGWHRLIEPINGDDNPPRKLPPPVAISPTGSLEDPLLSGVRAPPRML